MKANKLFYAASLIIGTLTLEACSTDDMATTHENNGTPRTIEITAVYPSEGTGTLKTPGTRVTYTQKGKGIESKWEKTDGVKFYGGSSFKNTPTDFTLARATGNKAVFTGTTEAKEGMIMYPAKEYPVAGYNLVMDISKQKGTLKDLKEVDYMWGKVNYNKKGNSTQDNYSVTMSKLTNTVHIIADVTLANKGAKIEKILISGKNFHNKQEVNNVGVAASSSVESESYVGYITIEPENMIINQDGKTPDIWFKTFQTDIYKAQDMTIQILLSNGKVFKKTYGTTKKDFKDAVKFYTDSYKRYGHVLNFINITAPVNPFTYLFSDGVSQTIDGYYGNNNAGAKDPAHPGWPIAWVITNAKAEDFGGGANAADGSKTDLKNIAIALTELESGDKWQGRYVNAWGPSANDNQYDNKPLETSSSKPQEDFNGWKYTYDATLTNNDTNTAKGNNKKYPLFYKTAKEFQTQKSPCDTGDGSRKMIVPAGCSDWFVPSYEQWRKCLYNNLQDKMLDTDFSTETETDHYYTNFEDPTMAATAELAFCYKLTNSALGLIDCKIGYSIQPGCIYAISTDGNTTGSVPYYIAFGCYGRPTKFNLSDDGVNPAGWDQTNYHKNRPMFTTRPFIAF